MRLSDNLAAFLLRVAAYFKGCLSSLPILERPSEEPLLLADNAVDETSEPLQAVRMNRHLLRRMCWLIKRGRVAKPSLRVYCPEEGRCNLTPGQFSEYIIRVYRTGRTRVYGLNLGRRALRLLSMGSAALQGDSLSLRKVALCLAPLTPD